MLHQGEDGPSHKNIVRAEILRPQQSGVLASGKTGWC